MDLFLSPSGVPSNLPWQFVLLSVVLAFLLSQVIAVTYERTYQGLSYSRALFQALALASIIATILMYTIGNNLARGLGIAGIFAVIRFRTNLRDPRDIVFIFASLSVGVACGIRAYSLALIGTGAFCAAAFYLRYVPLGSRKQFDGLLRFHLPTGSESAADVTQVLQDACRYFTLVTLREVGQGEQVEYAYQVKLGELEYREALVGVLKGIPGVADVSLLMQDTNVEL